MRQQYSTLYDYIRSYHFFFYIKLWPVSVSKDLRSVTARVIGSTFHVNKHYLVRI